MEQRTIIVDKKSTGGKRNKKKTKRNDAAKVISKKLNNDADTDARAIRNDLAVKALKTWACSHCTFVNRPEVRNCEMCTRTRFAGDKPKKKTAILPRDNLGSVDSAALSYAPDTTDCRRQWARVLQQEICSTPCQVEMR